MFSRVHAEREVGISMPGSENPRQRRAKAKKKAKKFLEKVKRFPGLVWRTAWKVGKEDPRRVIYALKVGVSLTLVSLLFLLEPLFQGIGKNAMWAVMTVALVLEFTAGATLCKGLNRGLGTLVAGSIGYYIQYIVNHANRISHAIFIAVAVFIIGAAATYIRFFPYIKKNYEYGVIIFLLTFNLITVSSYRVENVLKIAHERLYTIALGCAICLLMSLLIFPHWAGEDLHNSMVSKLEGLAKSIEACVNEYFDETELEETDDESTEDADEDLIYKGYKAVIDSKSSDETMALHASWEPRHSIHCYKYPWQQYVKLGAVLRNFGYTVVALHGCLRSEIQSPQPVRALFKNPCTRLSGEVSRVLMELANSIRNRSRFSPEILSDELHEALQDLNTALKSPSGHVIPPMPTQEYEQQQEKQLHEIHKLSAPSERKIVLKTQSSRVAVTNLDFSEALPLAAFASLLVEAVAKLDHVIEEVEALGKIARYYKECQSGHGSSSDQDENHYNKNDKVRVTCETPRVVLPE